MGFERQQKNKTGETKMPTERLLIYGCDLMIIQNHLKKLTDKISVKLIRLGTNLDGEPSFAISLDEIEQIK